MDNGQAEGVDILLKSTLDALGVPVERVIFKGEADTFITFLLINWQESEFADDDNTAIEFLFRVDIFSKHNYMELLKLAKDALKAAGFYNISVNAEMYENNTKLYRVSLDFNFMEVRLCG